VYSKRVETDISIAPHRRCLGAVQPLMVMLHMTWTRHPYIYSLMPLPFDVSLLDYYHTAAFYSSTNTIGFHNSRKHGSHSAIWRYPGPGAWVWSNGHQFWSWNQPHFGTGGAGAAESLRVGLYFLGHCGILTSPRLYLQPSILTVCPGRLQSRREREAPRRLHQEAQCAR
jgi:hypothetical protein